MKIAVLSDIHGNVPALEAVLDDLDRWRPDEVIVNGDLVSRGPHSLEVLRLLQTRRPACRFLTGNHETFVLSCAGETPDPQDPTFDLRRFAHWSAVRLGPALDEIRSWDDHLDLDDLEGGSSVHITHGSRLGNRSGIQPETSDEDLAAKLGDPRDLFVGSHTHRPLTRRFNGTLVVNTGSVGQPFDGDARSAYGRFTLRGGRWRAEIARVAYDKVRAERDFIDSGFVDECGPMAGLIFLEHRQNRMHCGPFMHRYHAAIKAGEISVAAAVEHYRQRL